MWEYASSRRDHSFRLQPFWESLCWLICTQDPIWGVSWSWYAKLNHFPVCCCCWGSVGWMFVIDSLFKTEVLSTLNTDCCWHVWFTNTMLQPWFESRRLQRYIRIAESLSSISFRLKSLPKANRQNGIESYMFSLIATHAVSRKFLAFLPLSFNFVPLNLVNWLYCFNVYHCIAKIVL